jgi:hypothetical protein
MKPFKYIKYIKEFNEKLLLNYIFVIGYILLIPVFILLIINNQVNLSIKLDLDYTFADSFCNITAYDFLIPIVIAIVSVYLNFCLKDSLVSSSIIKFKSRNAIWVKQVINIVISSLYCSLYIVLCTFIISSFSANKFINFDSVNSLFFYSTQNTVKNISFLSVLLNSFSSLFLGIFAMSILVLLIQWLTENIVISWIIMISLTMMDIVWGLSIFLKGLSMFYFHWIASEIVFGRVYNIIFIVFILMIGYFSSGKKDFINARY